MPLPWESAVQPMRTSGVRSSLPPPLAPGHAQPAIVTLTQLRCGPRAINEYVDSPRPLPFLPLKASPLPLGHAPSAQPPSPAPGPGHTLSLPCRASSHRGGGTATVTTHGNSGGGGGVSHHGNNVGVGGSVVVSTQPLSKAPPAPPLKDEGSGGPGGVSGAEPSRMGAGLGAGDGHSSIICAQCGRCRCGACCERRELPRRWCCGDRYEVSCRRAVEVCSCFCCVQTAFYHCGAEEDNACYDRPCACSGARCLSRWACLAVSALLLPCLCCYWPLQGGLLAATTCYNCCRTKGCQCAKRLPPEKAAPCSQTRRLLVESDSSSA